MSETEREELVRTDVQHVAHKLKGDKEDIKKKAPIRLRRKIRRVSRKRRRRRFLSLLALFLFALGVTIFLIYEHYVLYPGVVQRDSILLKDRGTDYIELTWDQTRNTDYYKVFYKTKEEMVFGIEQDSKDGTWSELKVSEPKARIEGLKEGETYAFAVKSENDGHTAKSTLNKFFTTQKTQTIKTDDQIIKFANSKPFKFDAEAETELTYEMEESDVLHIDEKTGNIVIDGIGTADVKITAKESWEFEGTTKTVTVTVMDIYPVSASGATPHSIYYASADNCEAHIAVEGAGGADVPQGMAFTGEKYMICFGMYGPTRIVNYDTDGSNREVIVPGVSLGHPNGFTFNPDKEWCYCVRGNSNKCAIYDVANGDFWTINMPVGCSGIGYDKERKKLYTSARGSLVSYDPESLSVENRFRRVRRGGTEYMQDCEAYDGLLLNCVSGSSKHGTNYIDIYDMENARYIGTITCDLGEVESAIVNNEGFLEILTNSSGTSDYIWKTDFNIKKIADEAKRYEEDS